MRVNCATWLFVAAAASSPAAAQEVHIGALDTTETVIATQANKRVTLRLRSGQELTGTVREVTAKLVVLGQVAGRELFDAVIPLEAVEAVLIRTK